VFISECVFAAPHIEPENTLTKKWQGMPESLAVYHRNEWPGLDQNI